MGIEKNLLMLSLAVLLNGGNGCQIDGVTNWLFIEEAEIYDYFQGTFWSRSASNIAGITNFSPGGGVSSERYISAALQDGNVTLTTTANYPLYEETETSDTMSFTLTFSCTDGTTNLLTFEIRVIDTNNNDPIFLPDDTYEFTVLPPLPPNFEITGCGQDIVVRDIDLTTTGIIFSLEENPYLEVVYEGRSPTEYKQFLASLRTKDLIRSLPEDVEITISATDVDQTGDPPRTTTATIKLKADAEFQFPVEPVFSQPLYLATYVEGQVVIEQPISLQQGFDDEVVFSLDEEQLSDPNLSNYFGITGTGNQVSINVTSLPDEVVRSGQVILVVRADRQYTSGDRATVIIQFPAVQALEFEEALYTGTILDNVLQPLQLNLKQGYEEDFSVAIQGEYASFFSTTIEINAITLTMTALDTFILNENNFLTLQVVASNEHSSNTAVVTIDIVKDDTVTPLFEKPIYMGEYTAETVLTIEQITLVQGYDESVSFSLQGDHSEYFQLTHDGATVTVTTSTIPVEIWTAQHILLTIGASKPRTITSTTTLSISLPPARVLLFEAPVYSGNLLDNVLTLPIISISTGYGEDVTFAIYGEYASYFSLSNTQDQVSVILHTVLPEDVISQNIFLTLTLQATGTHALPASSTLVLEILKQDLQTPMFTENVYKGIFENNNFELEGISLMQGYDSNVTFRLQGEHSQYFRLDNVENNVTLELELEIPADVIFNEKLLVFSVLADKPLTVGANAAISIAFSEDLTGAAVMGFSQTSYVGYLEINELNLDNIILRTGYAEPTEFTLSGEYVSYFSVNSTENVITISIANALTEEIIGNNKFIVLELKAERERAVPVTASVIIDIIKDEIVMPVFSKPYYVTLYSNGTFEEKVISLSQGYDETVSYALEGDHSQWFRLTNSGDNVVIGLDLSDGPIPDEILESNNFFLFTILALKPGTISAKATVFVDILKDIPDPVMLRFTQNSYVGRIYDEELYAPNITLLGELEPVEFIVTGDYAHHFTVTQTTPTDVQIQLINGFSETIDELAFIIIDIEAQYPDTISGYTSIVLEVVKQPQVINPVFEQAYYTGEFLEQELRFNQSIQLIQGFDESVVFTLAGDDARFFELIETENKALTLVVSNELEQIGDRSHLTFSIVANKADSVPGMAAIIISFPEFAAVMPLRFAQNVYKGSIENSSLSIDNILLEEGYSPDMSVDLTGDHVAYFQLTNQEGTFALQLSTDLPAEILEANNVLVFIIEVQLGDSRTHTTVILEIIKSEVNSLAFEEAYYVGLYSILGGFTFDPQITLMEGYDETVSFSLKGDDAENFEAVVSENSVSLTLNGTITGEIMINRHQLIFTIHASKPNTLDALSTVIISLISDSDTELSVLRFEKTTYIGSIENNTANLEVIILREGYNENVIFELFGDLNSYFSLSNNDEVVSLILRESLPDELIPGNEIIILELQASSPNTISARAAVVFQIDRETIETTHPIFSEAYYVGQYKTSDSLIFPETIKLSDGYDETVQFLLQGDNSEYFTLEFISANEISLKVDNFIPTEILINNDQFIFAVYAIKSGAATARAAIIISVIREENNDVYLGFDQLTYLGSIENDVVYLEPIVLSEGYSEGVLFILHGELQHYFNLSSENEKVTITLGESIPEDFIPENGLLILELQALALQTLPTSAAIIFQIKQEQIPTLQLVFDATYYTGHYTELEGLTFEEIIKLSEGYDENVQFSLEGDDSQYFDTIISNNSITLGLRTAIPPAVISNNQHLIFTIRAERSNAITSRATIIIFLRDDRTEDNVVLGFSRVSYSGSIENDIVTTEKIVMTEGFSEDVVFTLIGDLSIYFTITSTEADVQITLSTPISEELIPLNRILVMELQAAAPQATSAYATLVMEVIMQEDVEEMIFNSLYYTGEYSRENGLNMTEIMSLALGYDETVKFLLQGEQSQWFQIETSGNAVTLSMNDSVPNDILENYRKLIFFIFAEKPSRSANAVIVISLIADETSLDASFDKVLFQGRIEDGIVTHETITVNEYYGSEIEIIGDNSELFSASVTDGVVSIRSEEPVSLPAATFHVALEIRAGVASAVLILNVIQTGEVPEVAFDKTLYQGRVEDGIVTHETISLSGFDGSNIVLDGDYSDLFTASITNGVVTVQSSGSLTLPATLTFVALELRAGSTNAVLILDVIYSGDIPEVAFDKSLYQGRVEDGIVTHETISLSGFDGSNIILDGDYSDVFTASITNGVVTVQSSGSLSLPVTITFVALELKAGSTSAVLILDVIHSGDIPEVAFDKSLYQGRVEDGIVTHETISLSGFDGSNIVLDGDYSDLFTASITNGVVAVQSSGSLSLPATITFVALELRAGSTSAVLILDVIYSGEIPEVAFDKSLYQGRVEDGIVTHETISLSGFDGSNIVLDGDYSDVFTASITNGVVTVQSSGSLSLPVTITFVALELRAGSTSAVLILNVIHSGDIPEVAFDKSLYQGRVEDGIVTHETISLSGFDGSNIVLDGDYSDLFTASITNGVVAVQSSGSLSLPATITFVALELRAGSTSAVLILDVIYSGEIPEVAFDKSLYQGRVEDGIVTHETISLSGFDGSNIVLDGDYSDLFTASITNGVVTVQSSGSLSLPATITFVALELRAGSTSAVLILDVIYSGEIPEVAFDKSLYQGRVEDGIVTHETISLSGFDGSNIVLDGDYSDLFTASITNGVVTVQSSGSLSLPATITFVALELRAGSTSAVLILDVIYSGEIPEVAFDKSLYQGRVEDGIVTHETISLSGFDGSNIVLDGDYSDLFTASITNGVVTVQSSGSLSLPATITFVALELRAGSTSAVLILDVIYSGEIPEVAFDKSLYQGRVEDGIVTHETISLSGFDGSNIVLDGDYSDLFTASITNGVVTVQSSGSLSLPATITFVALELRAGSTSAVLILDVIYSGEIPEVAFDKSLYQGRVEDGIVTHETISLSGFDGSNVVLDGNYSDLFTASITNGVVTVQSSVSLTLPATLTFVALELRAGSATAVLLLNVIHSGELPIASFDKILYQGRVTDGAVTHETITLSGFSGSSIQLTGVYSALFTASISDGVVTVENTEFVTLPANLNFVALELEAGDTSAVLLLDVIHNETPVPPTVTFSSPSYNVRVDVTQIGVVGRVEASADNEEAVTYSLIVNDAHLLQRISVSNNGELYLSAPVNSGAYSFQVIATTLFSDATGTATVHLTVEAITICGDDSYVLPPLQIFDRDEESSHSLIAFNQEEFPGCRYILSNRWPNDQQWLYVNDTGLHTRSIDREHPSIAFMALSQVQVELTLECDSDGSDLRTKRAMQISPRIDQLDHLGPYDYGPYKWILTDSILHDSRKSLVNLIVNDINDNYPIFEGVENQPLTAGWPVADLEERIVPRYLAEVKATDADVGENAALVYWSNENFLAVSPTTGLVHVRNNAQLEDNVRLTVYATDRNGEGLTGSIELLVKLVNTSHIAVVTIKDAFLTDEENIISNLSASIGYEIKALRATVITDTESEEANLRLKREAIISTGASLQLYVYGLIQREPVEVKQLTEDINSIQSNMETIIIASTVSLEDHLESLLICPLLGRDTGLLVSTIVLAVLLFILIVAAAVWFFLKWRKEKNYEQFSDANSLGSRDESLNPTPKPENAQKPRMNIEELKRSERRLQEMLEAPVTEIAMEQTNSKVPEKIIEIKVTMPEPPLVIQSIDKLKAVDDDSEDEDEFGERKKARRKSVVTFNENVERIVHVEDTPNDDDTDFEVYRL